MKNKHLTKTGVKELIRELTDHIPSGAIVDGSKLTYRQTTENEVYQCGRQVGGDIQSGPFYCSEIAEWVSNEKSSSGGRLFLCEKHHANVHTRCIHFRSWPEDESKWPVEYL